MHTHLLASLEPRAMISAARSTTKAPPRPTDGVCGPQKIMGLDGRIMGRWELPRDDVGWFGGRVEEVGEGCVAARV